eukprot:PhF_6_TR35784/c0_g1_i1/m.52005/K20028/ZDHHC2_15_20; palmitoyltransferase ZDHHC2/15/20
MAGPITRPLWTFVPVFFIVFLMVWSCSTYILEAKPTPFPLCVLLFFFGMNMWSLCMAVLTSPGYIPMHWSCTHGPDPTRLAFELKGSGELRQCRRCNMYKPDRSHHCSSCDRCILKMDHHCPWINNCVGYFNQKFFLLFIFYITVCCTLVTLSGWEALWHSFDFLHEKKPHSPFKVIRGVNFAFAYCVALVFSASLTMFLAFHFKLVSQNTTTIERLEKQDKLRASSKMHLYDIGTYENFVAVFGDQWYLWLIPVATTEGDGTLYPVVRGATMMN